MGYIGYVDSIDGHVISGWAAESTDSKKRVSVDILKNGHRLERSEASDFRKDLKSAGLSDGNSGFTIHLDTPLDIEKDHIEILFAGTPISIPRKKSEGEKQKKLEKLILPLLKCISCDGEELLFEGDSLTCQSCGQEYRVHNFTPIMMLGDDAARALEYPDKVVVKNSYNEEMVEFISRFPRSTVLDMGSGNHSEESFFPGMDTIKMDIFAFPNIEVVGTAEKMPFRPGVFKAVISLAVLEHVVDPFISVRNISKIIEENGEFYTETAFLQPAHAFPNHYFNMTKEGLKYLCSDFEGIDSGVKPHQYPSFTIEWILYAWSEKLSGIEKKKFLNTKVKDIIAEYKGNPLSDRWMNKFTDKDIEELACGVFFHGRKK